MSNAFDRLNIKLRGRVQIFDDTKSVKLVDKYNAIHPQNMARIISRALANEDNSIFYRLALGNGGTFIDAGGNTVFRLPNDGTNGAGWQSRLYRETYSEIIDESSPFVGEDPGSAGPDNIRVGGGADPLPGENSVRSTEVNRNSIITTTVVLNENEPSGQLANQDDVIITAGERRFLFDELGIYSPGLPAAETAGTTSVDVNDVTSTDVVQITNGIDPITNLAGAPTKYGLRLRVDGVIKEVVISMPTAGTGSGPGGAFTFGDLCEGLNNASGPNSWYSTSGPTSPDNLASDPEGAFFFVTDRTGGIYPTILGRESFGFFTIESKSTGSTSTVEILDAANSNISISATSLPNLAFLLALGDSSKINVNDEAGRDAGVQNDAANTALERERLLTHIIFDPILKSADSRIRIVYTIEVSLEGCGDTLITESPTPTPSVTPTLTPTISLTPSISATPALTPTPTNTVTPTVTPSPTITGTPSVTVTPTTTLTPTPTVTPSPSEAVAPFFQSFRNSEPRWVDVSRDDSTAVVMWNNGSISNDLSYLLVYNKNDTDGWIGPSDMNPGDALPVNVVAIPPRIPGPNPGELVYDNTEIQNIDFIPFGTVSVSSSGDLIAVGSLKPAYTPLEFETRRGSVLIYRRQGNGEYTLQNTVVPSVDDSNYRGLFGQSVFLTSDGNRLLVSNRNENGASTPSTLWVFDYNSGTNDWDFQFQLRASVSAGGALAGGGIFNRGSATHMSRDGRFAVAKLGIITPSIAIFDLTNPPSLEPDGLTIFETQVINDPRPASSFNTFGATSRFSEDGEFLYVGYPKNVDVNLDDDDVEYGEVYIYQRNVGTYQLVDVITSDEQFRGDLFGNFLYPSPDKRFLIVGARTEDRNGYDSGTVYLFERTGVQWNLINKFFAPEGRSVETELGMRVSMTNESALLIANNFNDFSLGDLYAYRPSTADFTPTPSITPSVTPTISTTPTQTPTPTATTTASITPTPTLTVNASATPAPTPTPTAAATDFLVLGTSNTGTGSDTLDVARYDDDGALNWSFDLNDAVEKTATDPSGNVYVATSSGNQIRKFNSAGTEDTSGSWPISFTGVCEKLDTDLNGNVYAAITNSLDGFARKYDSSGVQQWSYALDPSNIFSTREPAQDLAYDYTNDLVYAVGTSDIYKINASTGSLITVQDITTGTSNRCIAVDRDGNVYVGFANGDLKKFDSTFTEIWSSVPHAGSGVDSITIDVNGNVYTSTLSTTPTEKVVRTRSDGSGADWSFDASAQVRDITLDKDGFIFGVTSTEIFRLNAVTGVEDLVDWPVTFPLVGSANAVSYTPLIGSNPFVWGSPAPTPSVSASPTPTPTNTVTPTPTPTDGVTPTVTPSSTPTTGYYLWARNATDLERYDSTGTLFDTVTSVSGDAIRAFNIDDELNAYIFSGTGSSGLLEKLDSSLNRLWQLTLSLPSSSTDIQIVLDKDKNIYVRKLGGLGQTVVTKVSSDGNLIWDTNSSIDGTPRLRSITTDINGNVFGGGYTGNLIRDDSFVYRLNPDDGTVAQTFTNSVFTGDITSIKADIDGSVYVGDYTGTLRKISSAGATLWEYVRFLGTDSSTTDFGLEITDIVIDGNRNVYVASDTAEIAKFTKDGDLIWKIRIEDYGDNPDTAVSNLAVDDVNNIVYAAINGQSSIPDRVISINSTTGDVISDPFINSIVFNDLRYKADYGVFPSIWTLDPTPTPSVTPTNTLTPTPTPTENASPTPTVTGTPVITPTNSPTQSITPTISVTPTNTVTPTPTVTLTPTVTVTSTVTVTPTITVTSTATPTITPTNSSTPSSTPPVTVTPTPTQSIGATQTPTPTPTITPTPSQVINFTDGFSAGGLFFPRVDKYPFSAAPISSSNIGNLARVNNTNNPIAGASSSTDGYQSGADPARTAIDRFPFNTPYTSSLNIGTLATSSPSGIGGSSGNSSSTNGYHNNSIINPPFTIRNVETYPFSNPFTTSNDAGDIGVRSTEGASSNSSTNAYIGNSDTATPPSPGVANVYSYPFSAPFSSFNTVGDLVRERNQASGLNSSTDGYVMGDSPSPGSSSIERFPFAAPFVTSTEIGDLIINPSATNGAIRGGQTANSDFDGYFGGGIITTPNAYTTLLQSFPFSNPFTSTSAVGSLGAPVRFQGTGHQG